MRPFLTDEVEQLFVGPKSTDISELERRADKDSANIFDEFTERI
jgi:hypothetical protein